MKKIALLSLGILISQTGSAGAVNLAVITSPPTILNLVILIVAAGALVVGFKLVDSLRGGLLQKSWKMFMVGFGVLILAQASALLQTFEVVAFPVWVTPALMAVWSGMFFYAVFETRRVLS